jgi:hypothetical protein
MKRAAKMTKRAEPYEILGAEVQLPPLLSNKFLRKDQNLLT